MEALGKSYLLVYPRRLGVVVSYTGVLGSMLGCFVR